ncbi:MULTISPECIES: GUN4 domain-containing protein [Cyanophyceae]|uniref:GUN4 domain-containing protein n=1 Tax=Cyanophyceae TaxID=3028117 RepID=UPI0016873AE3|nr:MULTISPECIES: GUN4 domain-containing protein [Cyanophyceae]MBD1919088.1 GUN4 domain-containing protein [Phormidium sp. FACHB-77]MBD2033089.1 GUN4 domain-containing protein [Phormidium sp. FACHB-322]MBD2054017.1 GUN4 domain-containing protein [Leptolyngbya sp. FACHB-60]
MSQLPPDSFSDKVTDVLIKLFIAGSGGSALYFLYLNELPKAVIAALVSAGAILLTSFGEGLMDKLKGGMKRQGEIVGEVTTEAVGTARDLTWARLSGLSKQYLEALKTHCHNLNVEGYKGRLPRLVLDEVYVPLRVNAGTQKGNSLHRRREIWDLLPKANQPDQTFPERLLAIIADPGYGKTTLLRFLTLSFANQSHTAQNAKPLIPILLLFRDFYGRIQSQTQPSLTQLIVEEVQKLPRCAELHTSELWFKEQLMQGRGLVMLDGLDEVPDAQRERVSQWANWQMQHYPSQFILTSRPHGYDGSLFAGVQRVDILDFNDDQKRTFIDQWYRFITWELTWKSHWQESQHDADLNKHLSREQAQAESNAAAQRAADDLKRQLFADRSLTDLAKNPLLITIIAATHEASEQLPTRRVHLYQEIFKLLLEYRPNRRDTRLTISNADDNQLILQRLAIKLTEAGITKFSPQQGTGWIQEPLTSLYPDPELTPKRFLQEIQQVSGLLAGGESNLYEFAHKTFQEYLAARELLASPTGRNRLMQKLSDKTWEEVVYFFAALSDPTPFIEAALKDSTNLYTLELAQRLANESPWIKDSIKQELLEALYYQTQESAEIQLAQRFQALMSVGDGVELSDYITWGEYILLIGDQVDGKFHSWADTDRFEVEEFSLKSLVNGITWEDARWFCAWLSTQSNLAPVRGVYDYRLPTVEELTTAGVEGTAALQPWTADSMRPGNSLRIVRQRIPERYQKLVNYLASGSWRDADGETYRIMKEVAGGRLSAKALREFPCEDLRIIDQLWVKHSGGKFGFSVQKQIYVETGNPLDGQYHEKTWHAFADRVGWRKDGNYLNYSNLKANPSLSPDGEFPCGVEGGWGFVEVSSLLLSHRDL